MRAPAPFPFKTASCSTVAVTAGYGLYTAQGSRNGKNLYISADGSSELSYSDRPDDRRWRGRRLPEELLLGKRECGKRESGKREHGNGSAVSVSTVGGVR